MADEVEGRGYSQALAVQVLIGASIALVGALLARWLGMPLPWMLGPLLLTAVTRVSGVQSRTLKPLRNMGQCLIGISLGLYFTAEVADSLLFYWPLIISAIVFAVLLGFLGTWVMMRFAGLDFSTAWFSSAIGGASEMAYLAERAGLRADLVASVHSIRVMIVVVLIPFAFQWLHDMPVPPVVHPVVQWPGLLYLFIPALFTGYVFHRLAWPNAWMLGPLFAVLLITVQGIHWSDFPPALSSLGQLCIGWSLGDRFKSDFFRRAPYLLLVATVFTLCMLLLSLLLAWCFALGMGIDIEMLILALSPGGIAEMAITAKVLGLGVPLVTAVHVSRLVLVVLSAGPMQRGLLGLLERRTN